jgi:D-3-phosphoglycerate dehydrogenase
MNVGAFDPFAQKWIDGVRREPTLADLLKKSDILSLHAPLNTETKGLIGTTELALLPPGAVLVNTSRGQLIDESALIRALTNKHLAGAALDVVAQERENDGRQKSPLLDYAGSHDNLLITPHIGGATYESMAKTEVFMALKLKKFLLKMYKD